MPPPPPVNLRNSPEGVFLHSCQPRKWNSSVRTQQNAMRETTTNLAACFSASILYATSDKTATSR